jgi:3-oxoacyl-[acyl-carrier-protein] synthase II
MTALIASSAIRTCLGDGRETFEGLLQGRCGVEPLRYLDSHRLNVSYAYPVRESDDEYEDWFRAGRLLSDCITAALEQSGIDCNRRKVIALIGTGLRELRAVERAVIEGVYFPIERLHFGGAVRQACPHISEVVTISNACSAGGHVLALAQDLIELGEADVVVVGAADVLTASMLAMIGRFAEQTADRVRPFDSERKGALLGEGAAALVLVPEDSKSAALGRVLATGLSCDAMHETVPDADGIRRAIRNAFETAQRRPQDVDLVIAHGTGTALNDPTEASLLGEFCNSDLRRPLVTAIKGAVGHNSGAAALVALDVALRCLAGGVVPGITGLRRPLEEGRTLPFVVATEAKQGLRLAQVNAFGFGGVNAVTLVESLQ